MKAKINFLSLDYRCVIVQQQQQQRQPVDRTLCDHK